MEDLDLLGHRVREVVTGIEGVATSIAFDLYGCVTALVTHPKDPISGSLPEQLWFDTKRLQVLSAEPVMAVPTFETIPGGQSLPDRKSVV